MRVEGEERVQEITEERYWNQWRKLWDQLFYADDGDERIHGESNGEASDGDMEPAALSVEVIEPCNIQWKRLWSQWCSPW